MANNVEELILQNRRTKCEIVQDTNEREGKWRLIQVIEQATVTVLVNNNLKSGDTYEGLTLPANIILGGDFTNIKLASGAVILYS